MPTPKISVIVPIYKVEAYLDNCIRSIKSQDYPNLEIILIDDGSPDRCPQMCDQYAMADSRIKVLHKPNGGLSDARNTGIKAASGDFILFIDSDDYWIDNCIVSKLVAVAEQFTDADLVFYGRTTFINNYSFAANMIDPDRINGHTVIDSLQYLLQSNDFIASACQKLIRRSVLTDNNIYFEKGRLSEDLDWSMRLYMHLNSIAAIADNAYGYRKRNGSITQSLDEKHIDDLIWLFDKWTKADIPHGLKDIYFSFLAYTYSGLLASLFRLPANKRNIIRQNLKAYAFLLKYTLNPKVRKVSFANKLLGYNLTCFLMQHYFKNRKKTLN